MATKRTITAILITASLAYFADAQAATDPKVPHTEGGRVDAYGGKFGDLRFVFDLHVTGRTMSEFKITPPKGVTLTKNVKIFDLSRKIIEAQVVMEDQSVKILFAQPVALGSRLTVQLEQVRTTNNSMIWDLSTSAKISDIDEYISLMSVRMQGPLYH